MRKRSSAPTRDDSRSREEAFINAASTEQEVTAPKTVDLHRYVHYHSWPLSLPDPSPSLAKGRNDLKKTILVYLTEQEWKSVDRHTTALGVSKNSWIKHAILRLLDEEQQAFLAMKEESEK